MKKIGVIGVVVTVLLLVATLRYCFLVKFDYIVPLENIESLAKIIAYEETINEEKYKNYNSFTSPEWLINDYEKDFKKNTSKQTEYLSNLPAKEFKKLFIEIKEFDYSKYTLSICLLLSIFLFVSLSVFTFSAITDR